MFRVKTERSGFTIVETMLSVIFLSILLIAVGTVANLVIKTYHRGIVIKMVNELNYSLSEDLTYSLRAGSINKDLDLISRPDKYGVLCSGSYSYIWNYAAAIKNQASGSTADLIQFEQYGRKKIARLLKVADPARTYCAPDLVAQASAIGAKLSSQATCANGSMTDCEASGFSELIRAADSDLMIYDFNLRPGLSAPNTGQRIYQLIFTIGTGSGNEILVGSNFQCDPTKYGQEYCALNKTEISILTRER